MKKFPVSIQQTAMLAPMAGVTDSAFRQLCREQGASCCVSEMISAKALTMGDKKTALLLAFVPEERPFGIQLFGSDPTVFAEAAAIVAERFSPDFIDINMGCPTPKITTNGSGSALMRSPETAAEIVRAVAESVALPVTCKIRAGYNNTTAPDLAPMLEQAGASLLVVHGRTRDRMYKPPVDLGVIKAVKERVGIPVIGNGDIFLPETAEKMLAATGCDAVMIGRGAMGNPFIFAATRSYLSKTPYTAPSLTRRMDTLRRQVSLMIEYKGSFLALREARKHVAWYTKGLRCAAQLRARSTELHTTDDLERFIDLVLNSNPHEA